MANNENNNLRIHLAAGGLLFVLVAVIALFWSFPKLLVYVLLAIVAGLAYGALYLILAAWMDPKGKPPPETHERPPLRVDDTLPDQTDPDLEPPAAPTRKKRTKKTKTTRKKKTTKKAR